MMALGGRTRELLYIRLEALAEDSLWVDLAHQLALIVRELHRLQQATVAECLLNREAGEVLQERLEMEGGRGELVAHRLSAVRGTGRRGARPVGGTRAARRCGRRVIRLKCQRSL